MTPELLKHLNPDELEMLERAEAATPGPWYRGFLAIESCDVVREHDGATVLLRASLGSVEIDEHNTRFVAHARTDLPTALQRLAEAQAEAAHYCELLVKLEKTP